MTTKPRLIALCSPAMGSGKTTLARHLVEQHGFLRLAFATPLKCMAVEFLRATGLSEPDIHERVFGSTKEEPIPGLGTLTSRRLQQLIGGEFGRDMIGTNVWVDIARSAVLTAGERGQSVVIDDMRHPNEADMVREMGGQCIRVVRPGATITQAHTSEGQLDGRPMRTIVNDSSIEVLTNQVDNLLRSL
jgi:hypothetical protein